MDRSRSLTGAPQARADLHLAPRISGGHEAGLRCLDVAKLWREHRVRRLGLDEIVDTSRAAAVFGILQGRELEVWNGAQHLERCRRHALHVKEMAGRIVGDAFAQWRADLGTRRR